MNSGHDALAECGPSINRETSPNMYMKIEVVCRPFVDIIYLDDPVFDEVMPTH